LDRTCCPAPSVANINGSSLIEAPEWLPDRLERFYLYFAHHRGDHIRLAYADALEGPWKIYHPGTLYLADAPGCRDHVASPDVHVDHWRRRIRMYFHGVDIHSGRQLSFLAWSPDGVHFGSVSPPLAIFYLRAVEWRGMWIGIAKGGVMYQSRFGVGGFRPLPDPAFPMRHPLGNAPGDVRHVALRVARDDLEVFFTRIGDRPERILQACINLRQDPSCWRARDERLVLAPEAHWEGAAMPLKSSEAGAATEPENAVRDPAVFVHDDRAYMLYSVAGESGIAIAEMEAEGQD
jgi:hypothetical protein